MWYTSRSIIGATHVEVRCRVDVEDDVSHVEEHPKLLLKDLTRNLQCRRHRDKRARCTAPKMQHNATRVRLREWGRPCGPGNEKRQQAYSN